MEILVYFMLVNYIYWIFLVINRNLKLIKGLLNLGASPEIINNNGESVIRLSKKYPNVVRLFEVFLIKTRVNRIVILYYF